MHLSELSPPVLRAFFYGVTYQMGNLASSASSTIEAIIGERFPLSPTASGKKRYDYGKVIGEQANTLPMQPPARPSLTKQSRHLSRRSLGLHHALHLRKPPYSPSPYSSIPFA